MKLMELFGRGIDRSAESDWRDQMASQAAARRAAPVAPNAVNGFWLITRQGKRIAGPFTNAESAQKYKDGRPDKVPTDALIKQL